MAAPAAAQKRRGSSGGRLGGGGAGRHRKGAEAPKTRGLPQKRRFWRDNEGGNSREIFTVFFFVFFGHVGAGGPQMDRTTFFSKILLVEAFWP